MVKTSVIITVYNRAELLRNALISMRNQSVLPDELIVSDDGSQEDMLRVIKAETDDLACQVRYVRQEDKGFRLARCRNNGVRVSNGDYLIFIDQDLILTRHFMKTFIQHQQDNRFCVSYPVRLTREQTRTIDARMIGMFDFNALVTPVQLQKIKRQYIKDGFYYHLRKLRLRNRGPKLRGGAAGINRKDFLKINGYDEKYIGWGNEDDDVSRRLNQMHVIGRNVSWHEFPLHLYHEPFHDDGKRVNQSYHEKNRSEISKGRFRAEYGFENPGDTEEIIIKNLN